MCQNTEEEEAGKQQIGVKKAGKQQRAVSEEGGMLREQQMEEMDAETRAETVGNKVVDVTHARLSWQRALHQKHPSRTRTICQYM